MVEKLLSNHLQLSELTLKRCQNLTSALLVPLSKLTTLTKLSLINLEEMVEKDEEEEEDQDPIIDFSQLSSLTNLVSLTLDEVHMHGDVSINPLWKHLVNLKQLILRSS